MSDGKGARGLWAVFRWPLLLALVSSAALLAALLGDGVWDAVSWALFVPPLVLCLRALWQAFRPAARGGR